MDELIKKEKERAMPPRAIIEGFVHTISFFPLSDYMRTEDQVQLWHHLRAKDSSFGRDKNYCEGFHGKEGIVLCHCCSTSQRKKPTYASC
jgi:hypothetical protein